MSIEFMAIKLMGTLKISIREKTLGITLIYNASRTEWSPIQSVIIQVTKKIPHSGSPVCLITIMITDRIQATRSPVTN